MGDKEIFSREFPFTGYSLDTSEASKVEVSESSLVSKLSAEWVTAKMARADLEAIWRECFMAYLMKKVVPDPKLNWQSKVMPPDIFRMVEQGVALFRTAITQSGKFYSLHPYVPELENICPSLEKLATHYLDTSNFLKALEETMKYGFVTGTMCIRPQWQRTYQTVGTTIVPKEGIKYEPQDIFEILLDEHERFTFKRRYLPNETISELMRLGELDKAELRDYPDADSLNQDAVQKHWQDFNRNEHFSELIYFYGTFYDGEMYFPNYEIVMLNRTHIVKSRPINNWVGNPLFIISKFYETTKGKYGIGLVEVLLSLYKELIIIYRMTVDNALLAIGGMIEVNKNLLDQSTIEKLQKDGFDPFMLFFKEQDGEALKKNDFANFNPNILPVIQMLKNDMERATPAINEITAGLPTSKGRPTAKEMTLKMGQGSQILSSVAKRIEGDILAKIVLYTIVLALENEKDEKLAYIIGEEKLEEINSFGKEKLVALLINDVGVKIDTISLLLQRQESLQRINMLLEIAMQLPNAQKIDFDYILTQYSILLGFAPKDIYRKETEEEIKQQQQAIKDISVFILESIFSDQTNKEEFLKELSKAMSERIGGMVDISAFEELLKKHSGKGGEQ